MRLESASTPYILNNFKDLNFRLLVATYRLYYKPEQLDVARSSPTKKKKEVNYNLIHKVTITNLNCSMLPGVLRLQKITKIEYYDLIHKLTC